MTNIRNGIIEIATRNGISKRIKPSGKTVTKGEKKC